MHKTSKILVILLLAGLVLGFQACTPPNGIFYNLEREKVLAVTNSAITHTVSSNHMEKYLTLRLVQSGTRLFVNNPSDSIGWQGVDTKGYSVVSFAVSGNYIYAIFVGNVGATVGQNATLQRATFTTRPDTSLTWTQIAIPASAVTPSAGLSAPTSDPTPFAVVAGNANDAIVQVMAYDNSNASYPLYSKYLFYIDSTNLLNPKQFTPNADFNIVASNGTFLLDEGNLYTFNYGGAAATLTATVTSITPTSSSQFTGMTVNGGTVFLSNIDGKITTNLNGAYATTSSFGHPLTGISYVSYFSGMSLSYNLANNSPILPPLLIVSTRDAGPMTINANTSADPYSLTQLSPDPILVGSYSSSSATNQTGVFYDATSHKLYFTTFSQGLWAAEFNPSGFNFSWE